MTAFEQAVHKAKKYLDENPDDIRATLASAIAGNFNSKRGSRNENFNSRDKYHTNSDEDIHNFIYRHK